MKMTINLGTMTLLDMISNLSDIEYAFAGRLTMSEYIALSQIITALEEGDGVIED